MIYIISQETMVTVPSHTDIDNQTLAQHGRRSRLQFNKGNQQEILIVSNPFTVVQFTT